MRRGRAARRRPGRRRLSEHLDARGAADAGARRHLGRPLVAVELDEVEADAVGDRRRLAPRGGRRRRRPARARPRTASAISRGRAGADVARAAGAEVERRAGRRPASTARLASSGRVTPQILTEPAHHGAPASSAQLGAPDRRRAGAIRRSGRRRSRRSRRQHDVGRVADAALGHLERLGGEPGRSAIECCEVDLEGAQVAVVDPHQLPRRRRAACEIGHVVGLDQRRPARGRGRGAA